LIIPVPDPEADERNEFVRWILEPVIKGGLVVTPALTAVCDSTEGYSAADFASLRAELIASSGPDGMTIAEILEVIEDRLPADIGEARRYQMLQALVNCTVKSLLPNGALLTKKEVMQLKVVWSQEIRKMEAEGFGK
jgi:hypothetical protein